MTSIPSFASRFSLLCCLHSLGYCQDLLIRTDRGRNVSVEWPVAPSVVGDYTYVSILHNGHVTMFCSDPFLVACQVNLRQMALLRVTDSSRLVVRLGFGVVNVEPQDAGSYRMEVVKSGDNSELRNVVFYVFRRPTRPIILGNRSVTQGGDVTLTCQSMLRSDPAEYRNTSSIHYTWIIRHIQNLSGSEETLSVSFGLDQIPGSVYGSHVIRGPVLTIHDVKRNTSLLSYRCAAQEANSSLTSSISDDVTINVMYNENLRVTVSVNGSHVLVALRKNGQLAKAWRGYFTVAKGDNVRLSCVADCNPECSYTWLEVSGLAQGSDSSLIVKTANCSLQIHICQVSNLARTLTAYIRVEVVERNPGNPESSMDHTADDIRTSTADGWTPTSSSWNGADDSWNSTPAFRDATSDMPESEIPDPVDTTTKANRSPTVSSWTPATSSWYIKNDSWSSAPVIRDSTSAVADRKRGTEEPITDTPSKDHVMFTADYKSGDEGGVTYEETWQFVDILVLVLSIVAGLSVCALICYVASLTIRWCRRKYRHQLVQISGIRRSSTENELTKVISGSVAGRLSIDSSMDKYTESREHRLSAVA